MILNFFFNNSVTVNSQQSTVNSQHNFKFFKINTNNRTIFYNPFPVTIGFNNFLYALSWQVKHEKYF